MKATKKKKPAASSEPNPKPTPRHRQRSLLESLGIVHGDAAARPPSLLPGHQRSLDGLAKVVRRNRGEEPVDVLSRCLGTLRAYQRAVAGWGGGAGNQGRGGNEGGGHEGAETAASPSTATEDQARSALRELSCVRSVDSALITAVGAGSALRRFRSDPRVEVTLGVQAEKILKSWREAVKSEVRARRRYREHAAAAASLGGGGGGTHAAASDGKAATPRGA